MRTHRTVFLTLGFLTAMPGLALAAQDEGGGAALFDINLGLSIWTVVVFAALLFVLGKYAWRPILGALEAREHGIQGALDDAARLREEAKGLLEQHRQQLAAARRDSQQILAESRDAADRLRKELEEKARAEGQAILERAREEIEREKEAALDALRRESVELALAAASKLVQQRLDSDADRAVVTGYLSRLAGDDRGARA